MRTLLACLNQGIKLIRVIRQIVSLKNQEASAADDHRGFALDGFVGQLSQLALRFTDGAGFNCGPILVWNWTAINGVVSPAERSSESV